MKLNNIAIPKPRNLSVVPIKISKFGRTASGRRVEDITAIKNQYILPYLGLKAITYDIFANCYNLGEIPFEYEDGGVAITKRVTIVSISRGIHTFNTNYSSDVTITLEEV